MNKQNLLAIGGVAFVAALMGSLVPVLLFGGLRNDSGASEYSAPAESWRKAPEKRPKLLSLITIDKDNPVWANAYLQRESAMGAEIVHRGADFLVVARPVDNMEKAQAEAQAFLESNIKAHFPNAANGR